MDTDNINMGSEMEKGGSGRGGGGGGRSPGAGSGALLYGSNNDGNSSDTSDTSSSSGSLSNETWIIIAYVVLGIFIVGMGMCWHELVYTPHMRLHPNDNILMVFQHWCGFGNQAAIQK